MKATRQKFLIIASLVILLLAWVGSAPPLAAQDIEVTSADPPEAEQDTVNLDVTIKGKGFDRSAKAKFFLTGTTNPGGVTVNSTKFVNSTELVANIDVAVDAVIATRDIVVQARKGRTGKGTELFSVTEKSTGGPCEMSGPPTPDGFSYVTELNPPTAEFGPDFGRVMDVGLVDLNGDGDVDDAIVAAVGPRKGGTVEVFVLDPVTGELLSGQPHITLRPDPLVDEGFGETFMGDVNADGVPEIAAGPTANQNMYVFFGSVSAEGVLQYKDEDRTHFPVPFTETSAYRSYRAIGDVTGNGYGDVIVGEGRATVAKQRNAGRVHVYEFDLGSGTFKFFREITDSTPNRGEVFGVSVAVGDVIQDSRDDLVIGAKGVDVGKERDAGMVFVYSVPLPREGDLLPVVELTTGKKGDSMGCNVITGNVNGDIYSDVITVGYLSPPTWVFTGAVFTGQDPEFTLFAEPGLDQHYGTNIAAGDLNADGLADVLVGDPGLSEDPAGECWLGGVYVYLSSGGEPLLSRFLFRAPDLEGGFYGWSVAAAPGTPIFLVSELRDVDGDGTVDGQVYVYKKDPVQ